MDKTQTQTASLAPHLAKAPSKAPCDLPGILAPVRQSNLRVRNQVLELLEQQLDGTSYVAKKLLHVSQALTVKENAKGNSKQVRSNISDLDQGASKRIRVDFQKAIFKCSQLSEEFQFKAK